MFTGLLCLLSACGSIRTSNRIEKAFLNAYKKDKASGITPTTYRVTDELLELQGPTSVKRERSIDVYLIDTTTHEEVSLDQFKKVIKLVSKNKNCTKYVKRFTRQKLAQKIHRYTALAAMAVGYTLLNSTSKSDNHQRTQQDKVTEGTGAFIMLAGFFDWISGGLDRLLMRRATAMKAAYVYHFGKAPVSWTQLK